MIDWTAVGVVLTGVAMIAGVLWLLVRNTMRAELGDFLRQADDRYVRRDDFREHRQELQAALDRLS